MARKDISLADMRNRIRERMQELVEEYGFSGSLDEASTVYKGKALTEFYIRDIDGQINNFSSEEIGNGLECDGSDDLGVDFVCKQDDHYFIYQFKYKGRNSSLTRNEISGFFDMYEAISDKEQLKNANAEVKDLLRGFSKDSSVTFSLVTTGKVSSSIRNWFDESKRKSVNNLQYSEDNVDWKLITMEEIKSEYIRAKSMDEAIEGEVEIPISTTNEIRAFIDLSSASGLENYKTYVVIVEGKHLEELYRKYKNRLFNDNIRGYLGKGAGNVNKKIMKTLSESPNLFYLYNNGISAVCDKISVKRTSQRKEAYNIVCDKFQIINGAQTVTSIWSFAKQNNGNSLEKVRVLMRITEGKDETTNIVTYNNSQNVIRNSDFRSNDQIQIDIEKRISEGNFVMPNFHSSSRVRKKILYSRKRQSQNKKRNEFRFGLEDLAKALYAFDNDDCPRLHSSTNFLFDVAEGAYWKVFGEKDEGLNDEVWKEVSVCDKDKIKKMVAVIVLNNFIDSMQKQKRKNYEKGNILYMAYTLPRHQLRCFGYLIEKKPKREQMKIVENIISDKDVFQEDGFVGQNYKNIMKAISSTLGHLADTGQLNFKTWQRDIQSLSMVKRQLDIETAQFSI